MSVSQAVAIGLDVGGTSIKGGLVTEGGTLTSSCRGAVAGGGDASELLQGFYNLLQELWAQAPQTIEGIGVGMPGPFDYEAGISYLQGLQKYDALYGLNLKEAWRAHFRLKKDFPIHFINDAAAFALGELRYGAARGYTRAIILTLGTGCGSAFAVHGKLVTEGQGVPEHGWVYNLPLREGIIDDSLSRRGILKLWEELAPRDRVIPIADVKDIAEAAKEGDAAARIVFERFGALIAEGLASVLHAFKPEALVIGGQIAKSFPLFYPSLQEGLKRERLELSVLRAADIDTGGVRGAASLVHARRNSA